MGIEVDAIRFAHEAHRLTTVAAACEAADFIDVLGVLQPGDRHLVNVTHAEVRVQRLLDT